MRTFESPKLFCFKKRQAKKLAKKFFSQLLITEKVVIMMKIYVELFYSDSFEYIIKVIDIS